MGFNLITSPWLHVVRASGKEDRIAPWQITDPADPVVDTLAPRQSLQAAQFQILVALFQTFLMPQDVSAWRDSYLTPPDSNTLKAALEVHASHFNLFGDGARFMQDPSLSETPDKEWWSVDLLPMNGVSENAVKLSKDLFVKRDSIKGLCETCAATMLFEKQNNVGEAGPGYFVSVRGGGPLTTFAWPNLERIKDAPLWKRIWANILSAEEGLEAAPENLDLVLPWMTNSKLGRDVSPAGTHALRALWGTPQRILFSPLGTTPETCDCCGAVEPLVSTFAKAPKGERYSGSGWLHPHTPHILAKDDAGWITIKGSLDKLGYENWPRYVYPKEGSAAALVIAKANTTLSPRGKVARKDGWGVWIHGFQTQQAKVEDYLSAKTPLLVADSIEQMKDIANQATNMSEAAGYVRRMLGFALKTALHAPKLEAISHFIASSSNDFFDVLQSYAVALGDSTPTASPEDLRLQASAKWLKTLRSTCKDAFELYVDNGQDSANPKLASEGRGIMNRSLNSKEIYAALGLPKPETESKNKTPEGEKRSQ